MEKEKGATQAHFNVSFAKGKEKVVLESNVTKKKPPRKRKTVSI